MQQMKTKERRQVESSLTRIHSAELLKATVAPGETPLHFEEEFEQQAALASMELSSITVANAQEFGLCIGWFLCAHS